MRELTLHDEIVLEIAETMKNNFRLMYNMSFSEKTITKLRYYRDINDDIVVDEHPAHYLTEMIEMLRFFVHVIHSEYPLPQNTVEEMNRLIEMLSLITGEVDSL